MYFIKSLVQLFYFFYFTAVAIQFLLDDIILGSGKILVWSGRPCYLFFLVVPLFVDTGKEGPWCLLVPFVCCIHLTSLKVCVRHMALELFFFCRRRSLKNLEKVFLLLYWLYFVIVNAGRRGGRRRRMWAAWRAVQAPALAWPSAGDPSLCQAALQPFTAVSWVTSASAAAVPADTFTATPITSSTSSRRCWSAKSLKPICVSSSTYPPDWISTSGSPHTVRPLVPLLFILYSRE